MPSFKVTAPDGTAYKLTAPEGASPQEIQAQVDNIITQHPASAPNQAAPLSAGGWQQGMDRDIPGFRPYLEAAAGGLADIPRGMANMVMHPVQTSSAVLDALKGGPQETLGLVSPTLRTLTRGQLPSGPDVVREAANVGGSMLLGKLLPELAVKTAKNVTRVLPGASVELNALAEPKIEALAQSLRPPPGAASDAYAALKTGLGDVKVYMGNFRQKLLDLLQQENAKLPGDQDHAWMDYLGTQYDATKEGLPFEQLHVAQQELGKSLGSFQSTSAGARPGAVTKGGPREYAKQLGQLREALDADSAAAKPIVIQQPAVAPDRQYSMPAQGNPTSGQWIDTPGAPPIIGPGVATADMLEKHPLWLAARRLHRQDMAATGLQEAVVKALGVGGEGWTSVGGINRLIKNIRASQKLAAIGSKSDTLWVNSFEPGEVNRIVDTLRSIKREVPALPKGSGVVTGSSKVNPRLFFGGIAGLGIGELLGHGTPMAREMGAMAGAAVPELIARGLMTEPGRRAVRAVMQIDPTAGPVFQQTLAAALRGTSARDPQTTTPMPSFAAPPPAPPLAPMSTRAPQILSASKAGLIPGPQALREQVTARGSGVSRADRAQLLKVLPPPPLPAPPAIR